jgi:hypothetical protein
MGFTMVFTMIYLSINGYVMGWNAYLDELWKKPSTVYGLIRKITDNNVILWDLGYIIMCIIYIYILYNQLDMTIGSIGCVRKWGIPI